MERKEKMLFPFLGSSFLLVAGSYAYPHILRYRESRFAPALPPPLQSEPNASRASFCQDGVDAMVSLTRPLYRARLGCQKMITERMAARRFADK